MNIDLILYWIGVACTALIALQLLILLVLLHWRMGAVALRRQVHLRRGNATFQKALAQELVEDERVRREAKVKAEELRKQRKGKP